jgi:hypothetical protein
MSIDDNNSDNIPVIKSRTGKFLQGVFDKKAPTTPRTRTTPTNQQEFLQVVPESITWDEGEESNWDDDFIEAPQPGFVAAEQQPSSTASPPPPPPASKTIPVVDNSDPSPSLSSETLANKNSPAPSTEAPIPSRVAKTDNTAGLPLEVSIPRPKNIKYKTKDPNAEPVPTTSAKTGEAIELDIQRPKNIKYKTKPPVKASLPDRLLAPFKSLVGNISAKFDRAPKIYIEQVPANGTIPSKKPWQLPSLDSKNFRQILVIVGALFLAMTVAWGVINFWPRSTSVATISPTPVIQPVPAPLVLAKPIVSKPIISPEAALIEAVKSRSQALANLYTPGFIVNLELDADKRLATVTVGEQQQQAAQSLWQQARNYQMTGLEVRATTDRLLARSPFIGTEAVLTSR